MHFNMQRHQQQAKKNKIVPAVSSQHANCHNNVIHRDTLESITNTLRTRCESGIHTHLGKISAHGRSLGNDLANALANQAAGGHPPGTTSTIGA
jgi:hypothetical protein